MNAETNDNAAPIDLEYRGLGERRQWFILHDRSAVVQCCFVLASCGNESLKVDMSIQ